MTPSFFRQSVSGLRPPQVVEKAEAQEAEQQLERREDSGGSVLWFTLHQRVANR